MPLDFLRSLHLDGIARKAGTAILVCPLGRIDAHAFIRFLLLVRGLPEQVVLIRAHVDYVSHVSAAEETKITRLGHGMQVGDFRYGFNDEVDLPGALSRTPGLALDPATTRYYVIDDRAADLGAMKGWPLWRQWLFAAMSAACAPAAEFFCLPAEATTEIQVRAAKC